MAASIPMMKGDLTTVESRETREEEETKEASLSNDILFPVIYPPSASVSDSLTRWQGCHSDRRRAMGFGDEVPCHTACLPGRACYRGARCITWSTVVTHISSDYPAA